MNFDSEQIRTYLSQIKSLEGELLSYRIVYEFVRDSGKFTLHELMTQLTKAKATVQAEMDAKYGEALRTLSDINDQASALKALKFLSEWTPTGKAH